MQEVSLALTVILCAVALLIGAGIAGWLAYRKGILKGVEQRKQQAEAAIGSAEKEAGRILEDAKKEAESKKKNVLIEAKDEIYKLRSDAEKEIKDRRSEIGRQERRIQQKEENLDKKTDNLDRKEESLKRKLKNAEEKLAEAEAVKEDQLQELERISGLTQDQAKEYILNTLEDELVHEKAVKLSYYEQQLKDECEEKARSYISLAIAKCAADQVPWNKAFLEKYIPYEVAVTELSFERIIVALWKKCGMQRVTGLKIEDVKYIMTASVSNVILTDIHELKKYALVLRPQRIAIRNVELYLNEFVLIYKMNERYRQKENAKWLAMILFIKHFLYEQMEQIKMGKLLSESLLLTYKNETFDVETLIGRYHANIYSENECIQIVEDPVNNPVIWIFAVLRYDFSIPKADRNDPRWFANESDGVMRRMQHNEQVNRFLWNIKGNGNSEYTDMEWLAKKICETVLNKVGNPRKKAWDKIWKDAFQMENEKNNGTVQLFGETAMLSAFKALYVTGISTENWIRMIKFYFVQEEAQAITVDMIENLNFVSLMNKDVLIAVAREFVQCKVVGTPQSSPARSRNTCAARTATLSAPQGR